MCFLQLSSVRNIFHYLIQQKSSCKLCIKKLVLCNICKNKDRRSQTQVISLKRSFVHVHSTKKSTWKIHKSGEHPCVDSWERSSLPSTEMQMHTILIAQELYPPNANIMNFWTNLKTPEEVWGLTRDSCHRKKWWWTGCDFPEVRYLSMANKLSQNNAPY